MLKSDTTEEDEEDERQRIEDIPHQDTVVLLMANSVIIICCLHPISHKFVKTITYLQLATQPVAKGSHSRKLVKTIIQ